MIFSIRKGEDTREVSTAWYNSPETMLPFLTSIQKVWELIAARREAGVYGRHERLTTFFIHGKIALLHDGNYGVRQAFKKDKEYPLLATFEELGNEDPINPIALDADLPWPTDVSCISGQSWTVENMHDFILAPDSTKEKRVCYTITELINKLTAQVKKELLNVLQKAGFTEVTEESFVETSNEYGSNLYRGSWFSVKTSLGLFTIGWRKRVIQCTIPESLDISCSKLIKDDVTKTTNMFHAWSYEDLEKYLKLIYDALTMKV